MGAKTLAPLEEYFRTSFDDYDREYVDGEIVERDLPNSPHSEIHWRFCLIFGELSKTLPFHGRPELRTRVAATRVRIADLSIYAGKKPAELVPSTPPLVAIEILSPDDRPSKLLEKLEDCQKWDVPHVWVVDPEKRELTVYRDGKRVKVGAYEIPEYNVKIPASEIFC
ncbi:MAG: Uma2 family endonuclease [Bryobacteraceae bacterium]